MSDKMRVSGYMRRTGPLQQRLIRPYERTIPRQNGNTRTTTTEASTRIGNSRDGEVAHEDSARPKQG